MKRQLRVLMIEDSEDDALLLEMQLAKGGYALIVDRVDTPDELVAALAKKSWDVVISDYLLPGFDGLAALQMVQKQCRDVPFILVSGAMGEELAVAAMKNGADDFLVKDRLSRLIPAVERAIRDCETRRQRRLAEEALRQSKQEWERTFDAVPDLIAIIDSKNRIVRANRALAERLGTTPEGCIGLPCYSLHGANSPPDYCPHALTLKDQREHSAEFAEKHLSGTFLFTTTPLFNERGEMSGTVHVARDITESKRAEQALRRSVERYRGLVAASAAAVWTAIAEGSVAEDSPSWRSWTGQTLNQYLGYGWLMAIHPDDRERAQSDWLTAEKHREPYQTEYRLWQAATGSYRPCLARAIPLMNDDGSVCEWVGMNIDISRLREAEAAQRESEERLRLALQASQMGWWHWDFVKNMVDGDETAKTLFGLEPDKPVASFEAALIYVHPDDVDRVRRHADEANATPGDHQIEFRVKCPDGSVRWVLVKGRTFVGPAGAPVRAMGIVTDITDRREAEEKLRESEERLRATFHKAAVGIIELEGDDDRCVAVNDRACEILGYRREELRGMTIHDLTYPEDRPQSDIYNSELRNGLRDTIQYEKRYLRRDGSPLWVHVAVSTIRDAEGRVERSIGTVEDISERKKAEEETRSMAEFPAENPYPVLRIATDGAVLYTNRPGVDLLDPTEQLPGYCLPRKFLEHVLPLVGLGGRHEFDLECSQGRVYSFLLAPSKHEGQFNLYGRDVTDRRRSEEALRESEERFRSLADATPVLVWQCGPDKECNYFNRTWLNFTGRTLEQELGNGWVEGVHPEDRSHCLEIFSDAVEHREPFEMEYRLRHRSGEYRWIIDRGVPRLTADGALLGYVGGCVDISDRKQAEEELETARDSAERAKASAVQANRAKDHFLAVLSHELRTPLTPVLMGVSLLQSRRDLPGNAHETLEMVRHNVEMEARLIDDLLDMTRIVRGKVELQKQRIELCRIIGHAVDACRSDIEGRGLEFGVDLGPSAPYWLEADPGRMQQVFWNLLKNAIKFTPHGGCVGIRCRPDNNGHVVAEVNDSGIGIESEALPRLFDAFEQAERSITRRFGGLGLGLSISKALVEMHGGQIEVYSEGKGKGASFRVRLALAAKTTEPEPPKSNDRERAPSRPLRILLVEDHGVTAKMIKMVLAMEGHSVETAGDVANGLQKALHNEFDLLISDLGLPDGSGHDLMQQLRQRGYKLPGIALSGYGQEDDVRRSYAVGFVAHLTKPASREAIVRAVASFAGRLPVRSDCKGAIRFRA